MGYCLYGHELSDQISPIAAGLEWVTRVEHLGIDREQITHDKTEGTPKRLVGFAMVARGIPRQGYALVNTSGENIGEVSSGTQSPSLNVGIGLGFVSQEYSSEGTSIAVQIRNKQVPAQVVNLPFWK